MSRRTTNASIALLAGLFSTLVACTDSSLLAPSSAESEIASLSTRVSDGDRCAPDSKFIGRIHLVASDDADSWWTLTRTGLDAAGIVDYETAIEGFFGMPFASLDDAKQFLVDQVKARDTNANGYVCAYESRGTLAVLRDPLNSYYVFKVRDDS